MQATPSSLELYRTSGRREDSCERGKGLLRLSTPWSSHICRAPCKKWACPPCAKRKARKLARLLSRAPANKFITLTQKAHEYETQREAFRRIGRNFHAFVKRLRREYGKENFEYIRVYETTKRGQPHIHVLADCPYISQKYLSEVWEEVSGAKIVDIRRIHNQSAVKSYLSKYLSKGAEMPDNIRRYSISWRMAKKIGQDVEEISPDKPHWSWIPGTIGSQVSSYEQNGWNVLILNPRLLIAWDANSPPVATSTETERSTWQHAAETAALEAAQWAQEHADTCTDEQCSIKVEAGVRYLEEDQRHPILSLEISEAGAEVPAYGNLHK